MQENRCDSKVAGAHSGKRRHAGPCRSKMIRFPPSPGDQLAMPATKLAHLLRLARYLRPYQCFTKNRRRSTCGFLFTLFAVVEGNRPNVVDRPISWRAGCADALARPKWSVFLRPRGIRGCYQCSAISKLCRFTTINTGSPTALAFFVKSQAVYLH